MNQVQFCIFCKSMWKEFFNSLTFELFRSEFYKTTVSLSVLFIPLLFLSLQGLCFTFSYIGSKVIFPGNPFIWGLTLVLSSKKIFHSTWQFWGLTIFFLPFHQAKTILLWLVFLTGGLKNNNIHIFIYMYMYVHTHTYIFYIIFIYIRNKI